MPARRYPDWESLEIAPSAPSAPSGPSSLSDDGPVAFCADLSPASVLGAYRRGIFPLPAADERFRTINEVRYSGRVADGTIGLVGSGRDDPYWVAWWSPDPRPVISVGQVHLGRNTRKWLRRSEVRTTANARFGQVAEECRTGREPRWLTDTLLRTLTELHAEGWAHSIEVWLDGDLVGGAMGIGIGRVISGDSLFSRHPGAARVAVADMAARLALAGGLLIDAQWDSPFLRSLGAEPLPRERYLPLLARSAAAPERTALPSQPLAARRLLGADPRGTLHGPDKRNRRVPVPTGRAGTLRACGQAGPDMRGSCPAAVPAGRSVKCLSRRGRECSRSSGDPERPCRVGEPGPGALRRPDPAREWPPTSEQAAEQAEDARDEVHGERADRRDESDYHFATPK